MSENTIQQLFADPTFVTVALVLAVIITLALFKKLFKIAMLLISLAILYGVYLIYTGEDPDPAIQDALERGKEAVEEVVDKANEVSEDLPGVLESDAVQDLKEQGEELIDTVNEKAEELIEKVKEE
jgi:F0F1-type ATP synthase membrane subunit b/b'